MNWIEFKDTMFALGCFSIHQVYAWQPGFDRNNLVRWTKKGYLVHLRRGWYAFPEYKDQPEFAEYIAGRILPQGKWGSDPDNLLTLCTFKP